MNIVKDTKKQEGENERLLDLGDHFLIYPIEKKRIIETIGVVKVE